MSSNIARDVWHHIYRPVVLEHAQLQSQRQPKILTWYALCRDASQAEDDMKSLQAEAEIAMRVARRAACRLKVTLPLTDVQDDQKSSQSIQKHLELHFMS